MPFALAALAFAALQNAPVVATKPAWTLLVYGAADNNADGHFFEFLNDVRAAIADDPALELVTFVDRHIGFSNDRTTFGEDFTGGRLYRLHAKSAQRLAGGAEFPECTLDSEFEPDSADPAMLKQFLAFGHARFPAARTALIIYSHASGITLCPDEQSRRSMGIPELAEVVGAAQSVDWVALELCNMGGVEIAYQWSAFADGFSTEVLTAIPNAGPPLDWKRVFERVHSPGHPAAIGRSDLLDPATLDARGFGRLAIEEGEKGRRERAKLGAAAAESVAHEAAASYDLEQVGALKEAVDAFARALAASDATGGDAGESGARRVLERLRDGGDGVAPVLNYVGGQFASGRAFVDLHALLARAAECNELTAAVRDAARAAMAATDALVIASFGMPGLVGFEPGRSGAFVHFPAGSAQVMSSGRSQPAWLASRWYSPQPFDDDKERAHVGSWAWCRDGATLGDGVVDNWFELLDAWYDSGHE